MQRVMSQVWLGTRDWVDNTRHHAVAAQKILLLESSHE